MSEQAAPPSAPYPGQPDPAVQAPPPAEPKKSRGRKVLTVIGLLLAIIAIGAVKGGL